MREGIASAVPGTALESSSENQLLRRRDVAPQCPATRHLRKPCRFPGHPRLARTQLRLVPARLRCSPRRAIRRSADRTWSSTEAGMTLSRRDLLALSGTALAGTTLNAS